MTIGSDRFSAPVSPATGARDSVLRDAAEDLREWLGNVVPDGPIVLTEPGTAPEERGVGAALLELQSLSPLRANGMIRHRAVARYLVWVWSPDAAEAQGWIGAVHFGAARDSRWRVSAEVGARQIWRDYGMTPRPAVVVETIVVDREAVLPAPLERIAPKYEPAV